jgi:hypothetical protein
MNETLQQIGTKHQTDKHDHNHLYLDIYHRYMNGIRNLPLNILEIGVRDGCSHRMWREYFPNSKVYGIDIDPRCKQSQSDRIKIYIGSQSDPAIINQAVADAVDGFDIILDDGSHVNSLTLKSFELLFPHLKRGGLYIIEDLDCSYIGKDLESAIKVGQWPGMQYNKDVEFVNNRQDMDTFFNQIIKSIDTKVGANKDVEWIHFYSRIAIMKKRT